MVYTPPFLILYSCTMATELGILGSHLGFSTKLIQFLLELLPMSLNEGSVYIGA